MFEVNLDNISALKRRLSDLLGQAFVKKIENIKTTGLTWSEDTRVKSIAHPFVWWWKTLCSEIDASTANGVLNTSELSIRALYLLNDLDSICTLPGFERIVNAITKDGTFYSGVFEAKVAAEYVRKGYTVEIVEEQSDRGERTPDLRIMCGDELVSVECKSLEDIDLRESVHWEELKRRLVQGMEKHSRSWCIRIYSNVQVGGREADAIAQLALKDIKSGSLEGRLVEEGRFAIEYEELAQPGEEFYGSPTFNMGQMRLPTVAITQKRLPSGLTVSINPQAVGIMPFTEENVTKRALHELKRASGQIPKSGPGIVHIELPYKQGSKLIQVVDNSYRDIQDKLNRDHQRVNAVVLSAYVFEPYFREPLKSHYFPVPNGRSRSILPHDFWMAGTNDVGLAIPQGGGGRLRFDFVVPVWHQGHTLLLLSQTSQDANYQIHVWKTWVNTIRIDVVDPSFKRRSFSSSEININPDRPYHVETVWDANNIDMYLNGVHL